MPKLEIAGFYKHVYEQLLLAEITKAQKDSQLISVFFFAFGIFGGKSCL